jgi:D-alanine-D-alanine ligase
MNSKTRVGFFCGGRSGEHEVSLISTKHVLRALDRQLYHPEIIYIQKSGKMLWAQEKDLEALPDNPRAIAGLQGRSIDFRPYAEKGRSAGFVVSGTSEFVEIDSAFPVLHGEGGEDGSIQGFLETARIPYVGCPIRAAANTMDKVVTKKICAASQLPVVPFQELRSPAELNKVSTSFPCFVKPATAGSSLGVSKVETASALKAAVEEAFRWSDRILIEPAIVGRELEVAVLDDGRSRVLSPVGEIVCKSGWYDYDSKYVNPDAAELVAPANLSSAQVAELHRIASGVFDALECRGMARIDFFLDQSGRFLLNEVNSIPGFTPISMYPRLLALAGVAYPELIGRILSSAGKPQKSL